MTALAFKSSRLSCYYKMDNVFYEILDQKRISKIERYEDWKEEVLRNLLQSGFIKAENNLYTITEEGREVIRQDGYLYYKKELKLKKAAFSDSDSEKKNGLFTQFWLLLIAGSLLSLVLLWFLMKYQIVTFLF